MGIIVFHITQPKIRENVQYLSNSFMEGTKAAKTNSMLKYAFLHVMLYEYIRIY